MSGFFARLGLGLLISVLSLSLVGGVQNAFGLLLVSIVCTAGVGLVFWIPLWWLIGAFTLDVLLRSVTGIPNWQSEPVPNPTALSQRDYLALKAYVGKAMASGMDSDEMTRHLQQNGWHKSDIESACQSFSFYRSTTT